MMRTGLEVILARGPGVLAGQRLGLICNQASTDSRFNSAKDLLFRDQRFDLRVLLSPQHGYDFAQWDNMDESADAVDRATGLPIVSLYSESRQPSAAGLADIDALLYDIQDVGTRVYTYIWTMYLAMRVCAETGTRFVVLDRPNPLNGLTMEGSVLDPDFASFVGLHSIPMRHGMTIGELALLFNHEASMGCDLEVVELQGWDRGCYLDETGLPWPFPSTGLPTLDSAVAFAGMVVFEGTNVSEGRGTTRPFELVGAPFVDAYELARAVTAQALPGVIVQPYYFTPTVNKHQGQGCGGLKLNITDRSRFQPLLTALTILRLIMAVAPRAFAWRPPPYEYEFEKPPVDIIAGTDRLRHLLDRGASQGELVEYCEAGLVDFARRRRQFLLY